MAGTLKRLAGPLALTNTYTTDIHNPASGLYNVIRHIHIANKTAGTVTFRLYIGATATNAAGTELFFDKSVGAYDVYDYYGALRLGSTDYLVGGASASTSLTITLEGDSNVA